MMPIRDIKAISEQCDDIEKQALAVALLAFIEDAE